MTTVTDKQWPDKQWSLRALFQSSWVLKKTSAIRPSGPALPSSKTEEFYPKPSSIINPVITFAEIFKSISEP